MKRVVVISLVVLTMTAPAAWHRAEAGRCPMVVDRSLSYTIGIAVVPARDGSSGAYAYIGAGEVLKVVDVSDPTNPVLVGRLVMPNTITTIAFHEDHVFVWAGTRSLRIVDVRVPENPQQVGWIDIGDVNLEFPVVEFAGRHAFISPDASYSGWLDSSPGIRVIDVGDPTAPVEVARYGGEYGDIAISGGILYALTSRPEGGWHIDFIDVSHPEDPTTLGSYRGPEDGWARDVMAEGSIVYVVSSEGLEAIDVSDPTAPVCIGATHVPSWTWNIELSDGCVLAHAGTHFEVIDVRDPSNPIHAGCCETPWTYGQPAAMAISGGLAYVSHAYQGLVVVDVSDPSCPSVIGQLVEGMSNDVAVAGRNGMRLQRQTILPSFFAGLRITDPSPPGGPVEMGFYESESSAPVKIAAAGDSAYLIFRGGGLEVVAIGDPSAPRRVGDRLKTAFHLNDIVVADSFAYLVVDWPGDGCDGLQIVDLSDPASPRVVGRNPNDYFEICGLEQPTSIAVSGSHAFLGSSSALVVIDVSDPSAPYEVIRVATPVEAIAIQGSYAYVAAREHGLRVYDIRVPTAPRQVSSLALPETAWGPDEARAITVAGRQVFLGSSQLQVFDISDPSRPHALWRYPNDGPWGPLMGPVAGVAVTGKSAFLAQSWLGSVILDTSACPGPQHEYRRSLEAP